MKHESPYETRLVLRAAGFSPLPIAGKAPPMKAWQKVEATQREIQRWDLTYPSAQNTGFHTRRTPTLDADIMNPEAAEAIEAMVRERFEERGYVLVRIGRPPKRCFPFRTDEPFKKITINFTAPAGSKEEKLEMLADGQQVVAFGIHKETKKPYRWFGGEPGKIKWEDLPYITEAEARQLIEDAGRLLVEKHGYVQPNGGGAQQPRDEACERADWAHLIARISEGTSLHDSLRDLAASFIGSGMPAGDATRLLNALMLAAPIAHDERWRERLAEIPRIVRSALKKYGEKPAAEEEPATPAATFPERTVADVLEVFAEWLILDDDTPVYAMLGTIAANLLPGDSVWLGLIAPPSSAKTEILNSTSLLPYVVPVATLTPAALLSGTPKRQYDKVARGGLLRQIGKFGILTLKDFGSILSMRPDAKAEVLAALREIYDGAWTRHIGTDGGKTLAWSGKVGLLFGATGVIDSHYGVIGAMGDRFLLCRLKPSDKGQFQRALAHVGAKTAIMRKALAEAVAGLFTAPRRDPQPLDTEEIARLDAIVTLVVKMRGAVERDRHTREMEAVYGAEGTARLGLTLERLLAGLDTLGVDREKALAVVESVAMDSVPPLRRRAYEFLHAHNVPADTPEIAEALGLPTNTVRRALEDLTAYGLTARTHQGAGRADQWHIAEGERG